VGWKDFHQNPEMLGIVAFLLVGGTRKIVALRLEKEDGIEQPDPIDDKTPSF